MLLTEIENIAKKESSFFVVEQKGNSYNVFLSEEFHKMFPDEVVSYNQFFISEAKKKYGDKVKIQKKNNIIMVEAETKEKKPLNKPMKGDVKKFKVYVKDPKTGNVKKVNFGDKNMEIKRDNPERKKSFRARHKCDQKKDKTKAGYWSCKMWGDKSVGDLLNEVVDADTINVDALKVKNKLCPKVWESDDKMKPEVRQVLLKNALEFIKFAKLEGAKFEDIILTGSLANYNWHEGSDLDVHILMDYDQIADDNEFVGDYFKTKKALWGERLPIQVAGHDVEMYVQDTNEPHTSTGVYSLLNDKWLTKPIKSMVALDIPNIRAKSMSFMDQIDDLLDSEVGTLRVEDIEKVMDKLKAYRKAGLDDEGEFSTENLVFKILRNTGYLEKLADLKQHILVNQLTLENVSMYDATLNEDGFKDKLKGWVRKGTLGLGVIVGLLSAGVSAHDMISNYGISPELIERAESFMTNPYEDLGLPDKTVKIK